jgi:hypothetical protein
MGAFTMRTGNMAFSSLRACAVLWTAASWQSSAVCAQASANFANVEGSSGQPIQLNYHASPPKNCSPAPLPTVRVITAPQVGVLAVRHREITINDVIGCGPIKTPVQLVSYYPLAGYAGSDDVRYEVTNSEGRVDIYQVTITVQEMPGPTK